MPWPGEARTAAMAGIDVRSSRESASAGFTAETPLDRDLPLTIDPSGVHFRQDGPTTYLAGCPADLIRRWTAMISSWIMTAGRTMSGRPSRQGIPQFEAIRVVNEWAGHYAFNTLDQNAISGCITRSAISSSRTDFRPRAAAEPGHGPRRVGTDHLWRISQPRPVAIFRDRIVYNRPIVETAVI